MADFNDIQYVNKLLSDAQEAEYDNREDVREVTHFLQKKDGQWQPEVIQRMSGRPRFTFDKCNPVVDSIAGEMEQAEFSIKIRPSGGEASKDLAKIFDGMIRNIQSMSNATNVFNAAGRKMVQSGFDAWRVVQDWADTDSFEQDLFIRKIANSVDRVWFDPGAEMQDMSDANYCFVLQALLTDDYKEKFPDGSMMSIGGNRTEEVYSYKPNFIITGEFIYKQPITKELVLMSNNAVYEVNDEFESVADELALSGIKEVKRRKKKSHKVVTRFFDGQKWLSEPKDMVFSYIPVIPTYGNFDISEDKVIYRGAVNKLMDGQRVYNYAQSRAIEEGALSPRGKYWMTAEQAQAHMATLETMNTNADPVQLYTHVDGQQTPFWQGGAQINSGLQQTANDMASNIVGSSGIFSANQGDAPNQSGYAIELQQNKGDTSTIKYFEAQEIAICHTARILVDAIPKVYDTKRTVRILGEDGSSKMEPINDQVMDNETGQMVTLNDLRKGKYDVTCSIGPAFKSRQQETARAFLDAAAIDPSIITMAKDIWLANLNAPGFDLISERARKQLLESGQIPDDQMTEEEKEKAKAIIEQANAEQENAANQGPTVMEKSIIEQTKANTAEIISRSQERQDKSELAVNKQQFEAGKFAATFKQDQTQAILDQQMAIVNALNTQADTLNKLKDVIGAQGIISEETKEAIEQQSEIVTDAQEAQIDEE